LLIFIAMRHILRSRGQDPVTCRRIRWMVPPLAFFAVAFLWPVASKYELITLQVGVGLFGATACLATALWWCSSDARHCELGLYALHVIADTSTSAALLELRASTPCAGALLALATISHFIMNCGVQCEVRRRDTFLMVEICMSLLTVIYIVMTSDDSPRQAEAASLTLSDATLPGVFIGLIVIVAGEVLFAQCFGGVSSESASDDFAARDFSRIWPVPSAGDGADIEAPQPPAPQRPEQFDLSALGQPVGFGEGDAERIPIDDEAALANPGQTTTPVEGHDEQRAPEQTALTAVVELDRGEIQDGSVPESATCSTDEQNSLCCDSSLSLSFSSSESAEDDGD